MSAGTRIVAGRPVDFDSTIPGGQAERLWPYRGRWIAQLDGEVLVDADAPLDVVAWLNEHGIRGVRVFRVSMRESDTETLIFGR